MKTSASYTSHVRRLIFAIPMLGFLYYFFTTSEYYFDIPTVINGKNANALKYVGDRRISESLSSSKEVSAKGWIRPEKIYGLIHYPNTAGTEINGIFSVKFDGVCGNKGYSYDAFKQNLRTAEYQLHNLNKEVTGDGRKLHNRGYVPIEIEKEIGFEDCDYIALEYDYHVWTWLTNRLGNMELHLPCRDPLDHLMSQCNYLQNTSHELANPFRCDAEDLEAEVEACLTGDRRFNSALKEDPSITLKCFDPMPVSSYVDYMSGILLHRRIESEYFHRDTNKPRDKGNECIWKAGKNFQQKVISILMKHEYYQYCHECMGSENEIAFSG